MLLPAIYNSLSEDSRKLFAQLRASIRREYHYALATVAGPEHYDASDDSILDALDIRLHSMFARGGHIISSGQEQSAGKPTATSNGESSIGSIAGLKPEDIANVEAQMRAAIDETPNTDPKVPLTPWQQPAPTPGA